MQSICIVLLMYGETLRDLSKFERLMRAIEGHPAVTCTVQPHQTPVTYIHGSVAMILLCLRLVGTRLALPAAGGPAAILVYGVRTAHGWMMLVHYSYHTSG